MSRKTATTRVFLAAAVCAAMVMPATASPRRRAAPSDPRRVPPVATSLSASESISLDLKDADLKDVLRTFAKLARLNIAIDPEVKGSVTVRLQDVPWGQAPDVILQLNGLGYVLEGDVLRVEDPRKLVPANPS